MDSKKRAIILDMDETLEHGILKNGYIAENGAMMVLRPNLDELIIKLKEAKDRGIDVILCTTAKNEWVERFLNLKPEFRTIFNKMLTHDNKDEWLDFDKEQNPVEYEVKQFDDDVVSSKPITTLGYDSILFIDDNKAEFDRLRRLFEIAQGKLKKDVTYFSAFGFNAGRINLSEIFGYKKASNKSSEIAEKLKQYIELERNNPGCQMMCCVIDNFMNKAFTNGITFVDEEYSAEYKQFYKQTYSLSDELDDIFYEMEEQNESELFEDFNMELEEYMSTDKKYPFEGIEIEEQQVDKRKQLKTLVQTAISTKKKVVEAQNLEKDYKKNSVQEIKYE